MIHEQKFQELLEALNTDDVAKFKSILPRFHHVPRRNLKPKFNMKFVYYHILLISVPHSDEIVGNEEIKKVSD